MTQVKNVIKDNYNMMLLNDFLREKIKESGFHKVEISKTPIGTKITLHVTRPGIVIGRKGVGIKELTEKIATDFELKNPQISVEEIPSAELSPSVMCSRMAAHLERGTAFRRATMWTIKQIMDAGAMGVQITISGKLRGDRSAFEKHTHGILPRAGNYAKNIVSEDVIHTKTPMGLIGINIKIAIKEKLIPEFELKTQPQSKAETDVKDSNDKLITKSETEQIKTEKEEIVKTETEQIKIEEEKMKTLVTLEEEEEKLK